MKGKSSIKFYFFALIFTAFFISCANENKKHHLALNEPQGFDSVFDTNSSTLKITSRADPSGQKRLILYFFSSMCDGCEAMAPILSQINAEQKNAIVYGIMTDSMGFDKDLALLDFKKINFITTSAPKSAKYFSQIISGITGTPTIVIFNENGKKSKTFVGVIEKDKILKEINKN